MIHQGLAVKQNKFDSNMGINDLLGNLKVDAYCLDTPAFCNRAQRRYEAHDPAEG